MNDERRKTVAKAKGLIDQALSDLNQVRDEEQDAFDNMPEGLQQGERGDKVQGNIDSLGEAIDGLENAISNLEAIE